MVVDEYPGRTGADSSIMVDELRAMLRHSP